MLLLFELKHEARSTSNGIWEECVTKSLCWNMRSLEHSLRPETVIVYFLLHIIVYKYTKKQFYCKSSNVSDHISYLRLLFVLATEHTLSFMFLNIWHQILFLGDLHDAALYNFCTIDCGTFNCHTVCNSLNNYQCTFT